MKTSVKFFVLALSTLLLSRCADEQTVEPKTPFDDLATTAAAYEDQFLTFKITTVSNDRQFEFTINGDGGKVSVNWGDGAIEKRTLSHTNGLFSHGYDREKNYTITVSGDIKSIKYFQKWHENLKVNDIHFGGLTNLEFLTMQAVINSPEVINISQNRKLKVLGFESLINLKEIIMPATHDIEHIGLINLPAITTPVADRIIARVHDVVVAKSIRNGVFLLREGFENGQGSQLLGSPSSYAVNKLRKLRDVYGWTVMPDFN